MAFVYFNFIVLNCIVSSVFQLEALNLISAKKQILIRLFPCRLGKDLKMRSGHDQFFRRETKRISYIDFVGIFLDIKVGGLDYLEHESQPRPR